MSRVTSSKKKQILALAMVMFLGFMALAFSQSASSSLRGTVMDITKGVLPGVTVTATNVDTAVKTTTLTDNSGIYTFQSLPAGKYTISAELDGFKTSNITDLSLGVSAQSNLDITLQVAEISTEVEVTTSAQDILTESSSSTGTVLPPTEITELPLTSNDVLELINIMGGVVPADNPLFGRQDQSFAGMTSQNINLQQDGISINEVRYNSGIASPSRVNTEMVGEFKMILSPVDAEMGRGMGQVQILTKSGTNDYHGSGVWNIQNSSLDAREWEIARQDQTPAWRNMNTYTLTFGGPIIKNKTFFFVSWDHAIPRSKTQVYATMLTPCAKKGIFRFFDGWANGAWDSTITPDYAGASTARPVVDANGFPLDQALADQEGYSFVGLGGTTQVIDTNFGNHLQYASVFGPLSAQAQALVEQDLLNCSQYDPYAGLYDPDNPSSKASLDALGLEPSEQYPTGYWEAEYDGETQAPLYRTMDTVFIPRLSGMADQLGINSYRSGDGLNTAAYQWTRTDKGSDTVYGVGEDNRRKNLTTKIDHNFSDRHRLSGMYTYESSGGDDAKIVWPDGFGGDVIRKPQRFSISLTSSMSPTLLNEARFGLSRTLTHTLNALDTPGSMDGARQAMRDLLPTDGWTDLYGEPYASDFYMVVGAYDGFTPGSSHPIGARGTMISSWGGTDNRWTIADTLTWTKGKHSFKFGGELRLVKSRQDAGGPISFDTQLAIPNALPGYTNASLALPTDLNASDIPGLVGASNYFDFFGLYDWTTGTIKGIRDLRDYMAGTIGRINQWFYVDPSDGNWNQVTAGERERIVDIRQKEMAFFAKDDWKVTNSLTLNLGLRYEYYGVPYAADGATLGLVGGAGSLFGISGTDFSYWMPETPIDYGTLMQQAFIGPGTEYPDQQVFNKDYNNFGPAVGFSWQLPWFGKGKTTLRGGYQMSYVAISNADPTFGFGSVIAGSTGATYNFNFSGTPEMPYLKISNMEDYLPISYFLPASIQPLNTTPIEHKGRSGSVSMYDPNIRNPYIHSLNLSLTRNLSSAVTLDIRYVGTLGRKSTGTIDLNSANWMNNGWIEDFNTARAGGTTDRLDHLFSGAAWGDSNKVVGVGGVTGGEILRDLYGSNLANGNYNDIAGNLNTLNYTQASGYWLDLSAYGWGIIWIPGKNESLPAIGQLDRGWALRYANMQYPGEFPENAFVANPQVGSANWNTNANHNNYHSMQVQVTVRPTHGFNMTGTYTWSRNLGTSSYTDPNDRANPFDYTLLANHRAHQVSMYGAWELPFGANGFFLRDVSSPVVRRIIEGWQMSWILNMASGRPADLAAGVNHLYGNSVPNIVNPDLFDPKDGHVTWNDNDRYGYYFGDKKYVRGPDPQCSDASLVAASIQSSCTMQAMYYDDNGNQSYDAGVDTIVFSQPLPGEYGNFGRNKLTGPGTFTLDMAMSKSVQLTEGKSLTVRVDAGNILNHPSPTGSWSVFGGSSQTNARDTNLVNPNLSMASGTDFGVFQAKAQHRTFQAKITLRF